MIIQCVTDLYINWTLNNAARNICAQTHVSSSVLYSHLMFLPSSWPQCQQLHVFLLYFSLLLIPPFHHCFCHKRFVFLSSSSYYPSLCSLSLSPFFLSCFLSQSFVSTLTSFTFCLPLTYHCPPPSFHLCTGAAAKMSLGCD